MRVPEENFCNGNNDMIVSRKNPRVKIIQHWLRKVSANNCHHEMSKGKLSKITFSTNASTKSKFQATRPPQIM